MILINHRCLRHYPAQRLGALGRAGHSRQQHGSRRCRLPPWYTSQAKSRLVRFSTKLERKECTKSHQTKSVANKRASLRMVRLWGCRTCSTYIIARSAAILTARCGSLDPASSGGSSATRRSAAAPLASEKTVGRAFASRFIACIVLIEQRKRNQ